MLSSSGAFDRWLVFSNDASTPKVERVSEKPTVVRDWPRAPIEASRRAQARSLSVSSWNSPRASSSSISSAAACRLVRLKSVTRVPAEGAQVPRACRSAKRGKLLVGDALGHEVVVGAAAR